MPRLELLPINQWIAPIEGSSEVLLREPTGELYDPDSVPAWVGSGVEHLRDSAADIKLTLLYNMQQTEGDLGAPGEFEELVETATLLGDSVILDSDGPDGLYVQRRFKALERGIPLFNTTACLDPDTKEMAAAIGEAMYDQAESADMLGKFLGAFKNKEAARRERTLQTAAAALAINAADWMLLENAGEVLSKKEQGKQHIVASVFPLSLDVARKADILGLQVDVRRINADSWPFDVTKESFILPSILATGKFDSTLV